jgi:hypothetical protein
MLVIKGNPPVADIYLGEFMRLHVHYAYRESLHFAKGRTPDCEERRKHLVESADWINGEKAGQGYFDPGSPRDIRRKYFSGC